MNYKNIFAIIITILLVIAGVSEGCKKYEEGPLLSFRSAKNRLYGKYILTSYSIDGTDSLYSYYDSLSLNFHFYYEDNYGYDICSMLGKRKDGGMSTLVWRWDLINKNKVLKVNYSDGNYPGWSSGPFRNHILPEWEILRLTNKEVKMITNYNSKEYLIKLEKQ